MAAHIHYDPAVQKSKEPCGLCLQYDQCTIYLMKGKGANASPMIDKKSSKCTGLIDFNYTTAATSTAASPCSNVPLKCPLCPSSSAAVWRYNLCIHIQSSHPYTDLRDHKPLWKITNTEKRLLKEVWDTRLEAKKTRTRTSKNTQGAPLIISEAHSSRLTLR